MIADCRYMDCHLHLQDEGTDAVTEHAQAAHITHLFCNATGPEDWRQVLDLAKLYYCVIPFIGVHPWFVERLANGWADALESLVKANRCGIGEIGLDFVKPVDRQAQIDVFHQQLAMAVDMGRPVTIHCVKAWAALTESLRRFCSLPCGFMVHAFNGSAEMARELIRRGGYVSFGPAALAENRRDKTKRLLQSLPPDRLLFETESPSGSNSHTRFLMPQPDQVNEPATLPLIVREAARLTGQDVEVFANGIYRNSLRFIAPLEKDVL
jgi:TatD DNase family protein